MELNAKEVTEQNFNTIEDEETDLSDIDDLLTPNEELINTIKSSDSEEEKLIKIEKLFKKDNKPNINLQDKNNDTPLHISVRIKVLKIIEFLVKNEADINIINNKGKTPLGYAKSLKRQDIIGILETSSKAQQSEEVPEISVIKREKEQLEKKNTNSQQSEVTKQSEESQKSTQATSDINQETKLEPEKKDTKAQQNKEAQQKKNTQAPQSGEYQQSEEAQQSPQKISAIKQEKDNKSNIDVQNIQKKEADSIVGNIYQLKLLTLFLYRGISERYSFRSEIEKAKPFDDLVFEYTKDGRKEYRFLQTKYRMDESKKITADDLLTRSDGDYSLTKYFFSYLDLKNQNILKDGSIIKDITICTNIDFDFENLKNAEILVEKITSNDNILDTKGVVNQPIRYKFNANIISLLKSHIQQYCLTKLAKRLAECILENSSIKHQDKNDIFRTYHQVLAKEVIYVKAKIFHKNFIDGQNISKIAKQFRNIFKVEIEKKSKDKLRLENINKDLSNKICVIGVKPIGLNLSNNFGVGKNETWPNEVFSDIEIKEFLHHLIFAVNQTKEEKLDKIIKHEIGKEFHLDFNTIREFFIQMQRSKSKGSFLNYEEGQELFRKLRYGILFDIKNPVLTFTGRELELCDLHNKIQCSSKKTAVISQVSSIGRLGGIGKTQLAREYIQRHSKDYDNNIIWINAVNEECLYESFLRLAKDKLEIFTKDVDGKEKDIEFIVEKVNKFFNSKKSLFIFDNAEKCEYFNKYLPLLTLNNKTSILIISHNREWEQDIETIELDVLSLQDAIQFVKNTLHILDDSQDKEIEKLIEKLQYFPLAIQHAITYISGEQTTTENSCNISNYIVEFENKTKELLDTKLFKEIANNYSQITFTTWKINLIKIESDTENGMLALKILNIIAYFAPENINRKILSNLKDVKKAKLKAAISLLEKYSMVNVDEAKQLRIHKLVQELIRIYLKDANKEEYVLNETLEMFNNKIDESNVDQAISVWSYASSEFDELIKSFDKIPSVIVTVLNSTSRHQQASTFGDKAFKLLERILGPEHSSVTYLKSNLAIVLFNQGKENDAGQIYTKLNKKQHITDITLKGKSQNLIKQDSRKGIILLNQGKLDEALEAFNEEYKLVKLGVMGSYGNIENNIGMTLLKQGKLDEALEMLQKSLKQKIEHLKPNDVSICNTKCNISSVLQEQGKYEDALQLLREAYEKKKEILGPKHPDTLATYYHVAICLNRLEKYDEAITIACEVDKVREQLFPNDPSNIEIKDLLYDSAHKKCSLLFQMNRHDEAVKLLEKVSNRKQEKVGPGVNIEHNIGTSSMQQDNLDEALKMFQDSLKQENFPFIPDDAATNLETNAQICSILQQQGKYDDALELLWEVYEKRKEIQGPKHPDTLYAHYQIAFCLFHLERYDQARKIAYEVANEREKLFPNDLSTLEIKNLIADILFKQDKLSDSLRIQKNIYEKKSKMLGKKHEDTLNSAHKIASLLFKMERYDEAIEIFEKNFRHKIEIFGSNDPRTIQAKIAAKAVWQAKLKDSISPSDAKTMQQEEVDANISDNHDSKALHVAAKSGNLKEVELLLNKGADVNAKNEDLLTPLHLATLYGHVAVVEKLLKEGADVNIKNPYKATALYVAAQFGHTRIAEILLNKTSVNVNDKVIVDQYSPLHIATQFGHTEVVKLLLEKGADINAKDSTDYTALHLAIHNGHNEIAEILLKKGANVNVKDTKFGITPLHLASSKGYLNIVEILLSKKANVNSATIKRITPLHYAAQEGRTEIVKLLLKNNADIEAMCIKEINLENRPKCETSHTALHLAAYYNHLRVVRVLLEAGANIDATNELNLTPLDFAIDPLTKLVIFSTKQLHDLVRENRDFLIIPNFVESGAVINYFSNANRLTSLHYAVSNGNFNVVELLLDKNPNINVRDKDDWTPLHYAARDGFVEIVQLLLDKGADYQIKNNKGQTPLDVAGEKLISDPKIYQKIIDILEASK